jgi:hypothetical protein
MVCEKAGIVILLIKMTAPGFETELVEMCFHKMEQCKIFEKQVVHQMIISSGNAIDFKTRCDPKRR